MILQRPGQRVLVFPGSEFGVELRQQVSGGTVGQLVLQPDGTAGKDTRITGRSPTQNGGNLAYITIGEILGSATGVDRALLQFNLGSIPATATITSAVLTLTLRSNGNTFASNNRTIQLYRVLRSWIEGTGAAGSGATWNTYDGVNAWGTAGCSNTTSDREAAGIGSHTMLTTDLAGSTHDFILAASAVQGWVSGALTNNGLVAIADTETDDLYDFASSDHATAAWRPKLVVDYIIP